MKKSILTLLFLISISVGVQAQAAGSPADTAKVYHVIDKMPQYPGGQGALRAFLVLHLSCDSREIRSPGKSRHEVHCQQKRKHQESVCRRLQDYRL